MPLAMLPAIPVAEKAPPAMLDAWLNLSHRENAREFVIVRANAMANIVSASVQIAFLSHPKTWANVVCRTHQREAAR